MQSPWLRAIGSMWSARTNKKALIRFTRIESILFLLLFAVLLGSAAFLVTEAHKTISHEVPTVRGVLREGVIGSPRLINPALAQTGPDRDLVDLIYAGLVTYNASGDIILELAENYEISEDGLEYTFTLKPDLRFHDGKLLTADDVVYTIQHIQDPLVKSPLRTSWEGIRVEALDSLTVKFTLGQPYAGFLHAATVGIMPRHIWQGIAYEHLVFTSYNLKPIGAGPYQLVRTRTNNETDSIERIDLVSFPRYSLGQPYLARLEMYFYDDIDSLEVALGDNTIDATAALGSAIPENQSDDYHLASAPLPRIFGLFLNDQAQPLLRNQALRSILADSINRQEIIADALGGFGEATDQPLPAVYLTPGAEASTIPDIDTLGARLERLGWTLDTDTGIRKKTGEGASTPLSFSLVTINHPTLIRVAEVIAKQAQSIGIELVVTPIDASELTESTIPRREFDILLFGQTYQHEANSFAFWHSSQRTDPGLNITNYANTRTDRLLETIFSETSESARQQALEDFAKIITEEDPAIFLYSPILTYWYPASITIDLQNLKGPEGRFATIHNWYQYTRRVLDIFKQE